MDLDAFSETHAPEWDRLAELTRRRVLDGAEAEVEAVRTQAGNLVPGRTS